MTDTNYDQSYPTIELTGAWASVAYYRVKTARTQNESGHIIYDFWTIGTNDDGFRTSNLANSIKVSRTGDFDWSDYDSTNNPTDLTNDNTATPATVTGEDSSSNTIFVFDKPATSAWPSGFEQSGSGGTGTEGINTSGTLTKNGTTLEIEIPASSDSGTYYLTSTDGSSIVAEASYIKYSVAITPSVLNFDQSKTWKLLDSSENVLDELAPANQKKVFCNFW